MSTPLRIALMGSGRMGTIRASHIYSNPRALLTGILDTDESAAKALAEVFSAPSSNCMTSVTSDKNPIQGLVVSSPTHTHIDAIRQAPDGIPIFLEKPIAEDAEGIREAFSIANSKGNTLCCSFQRRFDASYMSAAASVKNNSIGFPVSAHVTFGDHPCPPLSFLKEGGDIFMDLAPHDVDYICDTLQDKVKTVYATGCSSDPSLAAAGVIDNATMVCETVKGSTVTLTMSRSASYGYDQRCTFYGTEGASSVGNISKDSSVLANKDGVTTAVLQHSFPQRFHDAFASEIDAFLDVVESGAEWKVTEEECIHVQNVADAAGRSWREGGRVEVAGVL
mmetsp:Transcript_21222/g.42361  ORF Transcript_21222/g.42361 Transcript_21222/m.42361 type:complete len:336 (-) Transcript_21222:45-1052(-)|eukprot:CAMPEP_0182463226 /NCGR_PEP_ID=MMETSP1319-20130603/7214_1 /TAXON_ID=172717 /ORGANISM="Bolidomonas pacifica, Strain RCC208" /LENGTH=335 /DNA_ID=CAMNT_0024662739 /DNA_START=193 /DNA_END=1200 /DNA_ORIENTATION=+